MAVLICKYPASVPLKAGKTCSNVLHTTECESTLTKCKVIKSILPTEQQHRKLSHGWNAHPSKLPQIPELRQESIPIMEKRI